MENRLDRIPFPSQHDSRHLAIDLDREAFTVGHWADLSITIGFKLVEENRSECLLTRDVLSNLKHSSSDICFVHGGEFGEILIHHDQFSEHHELPSVASLRSPKNPVEQG